MELKCHALVANSRPLDTPRLDVRGKGRGGCLRFGASCSHAHGKAPVPRHYVICAQVHAGPCAPHAFPAPTHEHPRLTHTWSIPCRQKGSKHQHQKTHQCLQSVQHRAIRDSGALYYLGEVALNRLQHRQARRSVRQPFFEHGEERMHRQVAATGASLARWRSRWLTGSVGTSAVHTCVDSPRSRSAADIAASHVV